MNTADHQWEAGIRQKVEQYEFDFDPQAWDAMEQLLDTSGSTSPDSGNGQTRWSWWKLMLIGLAIGLLLFLLMRPNHIEDQLLGSFNVQISNQKTVSTSISPTTGASDTTHIVITDLNLKARAPKPLSISTAPATIAAPNEPEKMEAPTSRPKVLIVAPLERSTEIPLLQRKDTPPDFKIQDPPPSGRRRNRRTLFPDVIPKY